MAQHAHVPQFGNWENDGSIPYTQYFENARKGKSGGKIINPNDPEQTAEAFHDVPAIQASIPYTQYIENARKGKNGGVIMNSNDPEKTTEAFNSDTHDKHDLEPPMSKYELRTSKDDFSQPNESPLHQSYAARKPTTNSPHHRHGYRPNPGDYQRRVGRGSGGSDNSTDRSPLHPSHYPAKAANKGNMSPLSNYSSESSHTINSSAASRSRMRTGGRGDETPERGSAVPKFGEWDESNPSTADGYTHIFNQVRVEKQTGSAKSPMVSNDIVYIPGQESRNDTSGCGCFGWFKK